MQKRETVKEVIFYSYANLAMAHSARDKKASKYGVGNFMIRAKFFKGLKDGTMNMRSIFDDEKIKIQIGNIWLWILTQLFLLSYRIVKNSRDTCLKMPLPIVYFTNICFN